MTGRLARGRARVCRFCLTAIVGIGGAGAALGAEVDQASLEFGGSSIRDMLRYPAQAFQDYWYYVVGGVVVLLLLRAYLRK